MLTITLDIRTDNDVLIRTFNEDDVIEILKNNVLEKEGIEAGQAKIANVKL